MGVELGRFDIAVKNLVEREIPARVSQIQRKVALQALSGVVQRTPVDTGRARGNWQTSLDTPVTEVLETTDPNGTRTVSMGLGVIGKSRAFGVIWLSNNLPYIDALENGSSGQAPNGMTAVTVASIIAQFK